MASAAASRGENLCFLKAADVLMVDGRDLLGLEVTKHGLLDHFSKREGAFLEGEWRQNHLHRGKDNFFSMSTSLLQHHWLCLSPYFVSDNNK